MLQKLLKEHFILTVIFIFIVVYIVMNRQSIQSGVYITKNYVNPLLISLAIVLTLKILYGIFGCECDDVKMGTYSNVTQEFLNIPMKPSDSVMKGGNKYALEKVGKRDIFLKYN